MKKCPKCGAKNSDTAEYCSLCFFKFEGKAEDKITKQHNFASKQATSDASSKQASSPAELPERFRMAVPKRLLVLVVGAFVISGFAVLGILVFTGRLEIGETKQNGETKQKIVKKAEKKYRNIKSLSYKSDYNKSKAGEAPFVTVLKTPFLYSLRHETQNFSSFVVIDEKVNWEATYNNGIPEKRDQSFSMDLIDWYEKKSVNETRMGKLPEILKYLKKPDMAYVGIKKSRTGKICYYFSNYNNYMKAPYGEGELNKIYLDKKTLLPVEFVLRYVIEEDHPGLYELRSNYKVNEKVSDSEFLLPIPPQLNEVSSLFAAEAGARNRASERKGLPDFGLPVFLSSYRPLGFKWAGLRIDRREYTIEISLVFTKGKGVDANDRRYIWIEVASDPSALRLYPEAKTKAQPLKIGGTTGLYYVRPEINEQVIFLPKSGNWVQVMLDEADKDELIQVASLLQEFK